MKGNAAIEFSFTVDINMFFVDGENYKWQHTALISKITMWSRLLKLRENDGKVSLRTLHFG